MPFPSLQSKFERTSPCTFGCVTIFKMDAQCAYYQIAMKLDGNAQSGNCSGCGLSDNTYSLVSGDI